MDNNLLVPRLCKMGFIFFHYIYNKCPTPTTSASEGHSSLEKEEIDGQDIWLQMPSRCSLGVVCESYYAFSKKANLGKRIPPARLPGAPWKNLESCWRTREISFGKWLDVSSVSPAIHRFDTEPDRSLCWIHSSPSYFGRMCHFSQLDTSNSSLCMAVLQFAYARFLTTV